MKKYVGLVVILAAFGFLIATSLNSNAMKSIPVHELRAADSSPHSYVGQRLRVVGFVGKKPVESRPMSTDSGTGTVHHFTVVDKGQTLNVALSRCVARHISRRRPGAGGWRLHRTRRDKSRSRFDQVPLEIRSRIEGAKNRHEIRAKSGNLPAKTAFPAEKSLHASFHRTFLLLLAFACAVYGIAITIAAYRLPLARRRACLSSAFNASLAIWWLVAAASGLLIYLFLTDDFSVNYVWAHSSLAQPIQYKVSAMWAGQSGSLLLWTLMLAGYGALIAVVGRRHESGGDKLEVQLAPTAAAVVHGINLLFLGLVCFVTNPFEAGIGARRMAAA